MPHVLVAGKLHPSGRALLTGAEGLSVTFIEEVSEESYAPHVHEADALLIRTQPMSAATVEKASRLQIVSRHGVGFDAVDLAALNNRGIALAVCGDVNSTSVAEHAVMMILASAKRALRADAAVRQGPWTWRDKLEAQDLKGRNLLLIGFGRIGQHIADMVAGFGMDARAHDPFLLRSGWPDCPVEPVSSLEEGLGWADIISVNVPRAEKPVLGEAEFAQMRDGAILVNTARGGTVDEAALVDALQSGRVAAAGLDVFDKEPIGPGHPLTAFDQVLLSPHIAGVTDGASERMAIGSAQNIIDYFAGRIAPELVVNRAALGGKVGA